jgi:hypothetical protein
MGGKKENNWGEKLDDVLEIVTFIKDNAVMKNDFEKRMGNIENRLTKVESQMVTKEYLDDKLADLRGDLVVMMRKEDNKLKTLVEILQTKKIITKTDVSKVMAMEPFAQLVV